MNEDQIIGALIGLVGACGNHGRTAEADRLLVRALAALRPEMDAAAAERLAEEIRREKFAIAPGCAVCAAPCGNTSDYDMSRLAEASEGVRAAKRQILASIRSIAAEISAGERADTAFLYKALAYVGYDMEEAPLRALLAEAEELANYKNTGGNEL